MRKVEKDFHLSYQLGYSNYTFELWLLLLFRFVLFIGYVPTESMEPTLKRGSIIVGSRLFGELKVGDIVVFRHEGKLLVKRIAAEGSDIINHKETELTVPSGCLYMLGDYPGNFFDSRFWDDPFITNKDVIAVLGSTLN